MTDMRIYQRPTRESYSLKTYDIQGATTKPKIHEVKLVNPNRYKNTNYNSSQNYPSQSQQDNLPRAYELERDLRMNQE